MLKRTLWVVVIVALCCSLGVLAVYATQASKAHLSTQTKGIAAHPTLSPDKAAPEGTYSIPAKKASTVGQVIASRTEYDYAKENYIRRQEGSLLSKDEEALVQRYFGSRDDGDNSLDAVGGPDGYNYYFVDSQAPDTAAYSWVEIKTTGTRITALNGQDDLAAAFTIGFSFPFYGSNYTTGSICSNGNIQFGGSLNRYWSNSALPYAGDATYGLVGPAIFPLWDDLMIGSGAIGGVYVQNFNNQYCVVEWDSVTNFSGGGAPKFEAILYADGKIKFQYNSIVSQSPTVGIQGAGTGTNFLQYQYNATGQQVATGRAIWFYRFVPPTAELGLSNLTPCGAVNPNPAASVSFRVTNAGAVASTPVTAYFNFDNGATTQNVAVPAIAPSSFFDVFFTTTVNLSIGNHTLSGWFLPHDNPAGNDSAFCALTVARLCPTLLPADLSLDPIPTTPWAGSVTGNCGNGGKWDGSFSATAGYTYHFDLCPDAPGAGTASFDVDIKICDAAGTILAGQDGACTALSYHPNDFTWTPVTSGTYYVVLAPYSSYASHTCTGTAASTFTMQYYVATEIAPGETCANALPFTLDTPYNGTTVGFQDNYESVCPYSSTSPDVVYSYTPSVDQLVTFSLCQGTTDYDTKLFVFAGSCDGTPVGCNDDACTAPLFPNPYVSRVACLQLTAGTTYFIVVDGYGGESGNYTLLGTACFCDIQEQAGDIAEVTEPWPIPNNFSQNDPDGGCNNRPGTPLFQNIQCGETIFGKTFMYTDNISGLLYRDTDWYRLVVNTTTYATWSVTGEDSLAAIIVKHVMDPCSTLSLTAAVSAGMCSTATVSACLLPGTYYMWVGCYKSSPSAAPFDYRATLTCGTCPTGRCCYGSDPANPLCADNVEPACTALGGAWDVTMTCAGNPCPTHLACQTGNIMLTQPPYNADEAWAGVTSEASQTYLAYDNYSVSSPIGSVRFWGLDAYNGGSWATCDEDPMPFTISFHLDSLGYPASAAVCSYDVSLTRVATGMNYVSGTLNFPVWEYDAVLSPPCTQLSGWIEIVAGGSTTCWFLWAASPFGDATMWQWNGQLLQWSNPGYGSLALCLASGCDATVLASHVTAYMSPDNVHPWINFHAPVDGDYRIYSTTDKTIGYPNPGWTLETTVTVTSGEHVWTDTGTVQTYKRYVVIHNCP
ncbi:MAG TPA: hypothetical protein VGL38_00885 [bacterium]|jgi:hypothetical protein